MCIRSFKEMKVRRIVHEQKGSRKAFKVFIIAQYFKQGNGTKPCLHTNN